MVFNGTYFEKIYIYYNLPNMEGREFPSLTIIMFEMIFQNIHEWTIVLLLAGFKVKMKNGWSNVI